MLFAQFYQKSAIGPEIIEACGDRSVIIYDARVHQELTIVDAVAECKKRGFVAFALFHGQTFTRSTRITSIQKVN
jgi:hypothetical protein